jgi:hypothetical protein
MKKKFNHAYSEITSFDDFRLEKERLLLKRKLIETRLKLSYSRITNAFSVSNSLFSLAREYLYPKLTGWVERFFRKD